jgi:integrase
MRSSEAIWGRAVRYVRFESSSPYRNKDGIIRRKLKVSFLYQAPGDARPIRHRESTGLDDSRDNRRKWKASLRELERELIRARFGTAESLDLRRWFPRSRTSSKVMFSQAATVEAFARRYLDELSGAGIGAHTLEQYRHIFRAHIFGSDLAGVPLRELNDGHIKLWLGQLQAKPVRVEGRALQPSTTNKILARVRIMVTLAWRRGEIGRPVNPMDLVDNLPMKGREPDPFSPDELLALLEACDGQQRALYITLALTGLRPSEALALYWEEHLDYERERILVRQQLRNDGSVDSKLKTQRSERDVMMFEPVRIALRALALHNRMRSRFVFANRKGKPLNERTQGDDPWRRAVARAELEYRPLYTLRHTYTFLMLSAGKPLQWVADQLGHVGVKKIDEVYGRWKQRHKLPDKQLDLEKLFGEIRKLPPDAASKTARDNSLTSGTAP